MSSKIPENSAFSFPVCKTIYPNSSNSAMINVLKISLLAIGVFALVALSTIFPILPPLAASLIGAGTLIFPFVLDIFIGLGTWFYNRRCSSESVKLQKPLPPLTSQGTVVSATALKQEKYGTILRYLANWCAQQQLCKNKNQPLSNSTTLLLTFLKHPVIDSKKQQDYREQYKGFIKVLRTDLKKVTNRAELEFLEDLCYTRYAEVKIFPYLSKKVEPFLGHSFDRSLSSQDFASVLTEDTTTIHRVPLSKKKSKTALNVQKLSGTLNAGFDPSSSMNTPYARSKMTFTKPDGSSKILTILRHGAPTKENPGFIEFTNATYNKMKGKQAKIAKIVPEYEAFLRAAQRRGKQLLYVNHQKMNVVKVIGDESDRSLAIQKLEDPSKHPNFHFASFPMDNGFLSTSFWDDRKDNGAVLEDTLKNILIDAINKKNEIILPKGIYISKLIINEIPGLLQKICKAYFNNQKSYSSKECKIFVLLFYSHLKSWIVEKLNIDLIVSACKDSIDRGNASTSIDEYIALFLLEEENNPTFLQNQRIQLHAPSLLVKQQEIMSGRLEFFTSVINFLNKLSPQQQQEVRNTFGPKSKNSSWKISKLSLDLSPEGALL